MIFAEIFPLHDEAESHVSTLHYAVESQISLLHNAKFFTRLLRTAKFDSVLHHAARRFDSPLHCAVGGENDNSKENMHYAAGSQI